MQLSALRPLRFDNSPKPAASEYTEEAYTPVEREQLGTLRSAKVSKPLIGLPSDLKKIEQGQPAEAEATRQKLIGESGVKSLRPVKNRWAGGMEGYDIKDVGKVLQEVSKGRTDFQTVLQNTPPDKQSELRVAFAMVNMADAAMFQLTKKEASGADWYDEGTAHFEAGVVHLVNSVPALKPLKGKLGQIDRKTGRVKDANKPGMVLFKAIMTPTSYGQRPDWNTEWAVRILEAAVAATPPGESPFAHIPPRNPATGKQWTPQLNPSHLDVINRLVRQFGEDGAAKWLLQRHTAKEIKAIHPAFKPISTYGKDHLYAGAYVFGPKGASYFRGMNRRESEATKDKWFIRTYRRILGTLMQGDEIGDTNIAPEERVEMDASVGLAQKALGLTADELQAALWYHEQQLWRSMGATVESKGLKEGIHEALGRRGLKPPQVKRVSSPAEERRQAAYAEAARRSPLRHSRQVEGGRLRLSPLRFAAVEQPPAPAYQPMPAPPQAANPAQMGGQLAAPAQLPPIDEHRETLLAYSPNVDDLSFEDALARSRSGNHKAFKKIVQHINEQVGLHAHLSDAIGDWSDGAENSILQRIDEPVDQKTVDYLASWYGLLANQKAVLAFTPLHGGLDSVYQIELPQTDLEQIRKSLDKAGIPFRTLVPSKKGTKVVIYDEQRGLRDQVAAWAGQHNASIRESIGQGRFIGGSTRTAARAAYRKNITAYEAAASKSGGQVRAYRPSVLPNHLRSEQGEEAPIRKARSGQVVKFAAVDPMHDVSIPRDTWTVKGELDRMVGAFKEAIQNTKERFQDAVRQAKKPKRGKRKFAAGGDEIWKHVVEAVKLHGGEHNHARLHKVRQHLESKGLRDRKQQDAAIRAARLAGHVGASALEGRYSSPEEREAAIREGDDLLGSLHLKEDSPLRYSGIQAPAGGVVVRGLFYPGGKWIPSANLEKASYDQYQHVEKQRAKKYRRGDGSVSVEPALASAGARTTSL